MTYNEITKKIIANHLFREYNRLYPGEKISHNQITKDYWVGAVIKINDKISFEPSESDGAEAYSCYGYMDFSEENKAYFLNYVDRMIAASVYDISYNFSDAYPTYEYCNGENKVFITYLTSEDGSESRPTFSAFLCKQTY
ncbi:MAG: hypothetical protein Q4B26_06770 [Eubacteriales bacterium]|nr:hypothetical protein [Eubacteriales bacterium]